MPNHTLAPNSLPRLSFSLKIHSTGVRLNPICKGRDFGAASCKMETGEAALDRGSKRDAPCWESLPPAVLGRCLLGVPRGGEDANTREPTGANTREAFLWAARRERAATRMAVFSTCKAFAKALLGSATKPRVTIRLAHHNQVSLQALVHVLHWAGPCCTNLGLEVIGAHSAPLSLRMLLDLLHQGGVSLPTATHAYCLEVVLDGELAGVLPNLQRLQLQKCSIPATALPLAGCSQLQKLKVTLAPTGAVSHQQQAWLPQLQQLANLPSLSSLHIDPELFPTSFLPLLSGQLTKLAYPNLTGRNTSTMQRWKAAIEAAAQCSNLRKLRLGASAGLGMLTPLTQLRELKLFEFVPVDTDGLVSTLLQHFPHLTRLTCWDLGRLQRSYADSQCSWTQLRLYNATPQVLARLPLHSLTQPLQLQQLQLDQPGLSVADVQAAVHNLARSGQHPPLVSGYYRHRRHDDPKSMAIWFAPEASMLPVAPVESPVALLRAAGPLVCQDITKVVIHHAEADAELVMALQEVTPPTITSIMLWDCSVLPSFWTQLARSFPLLTMLRLMELQGECSGVQVVGYYYAAAYARHAASGGAGQQPAAGAPHAADIDIVVSEDDFMEWRLHEVDATVQLLGLQATCSCHLTALT